MALALLGAAIALVPIALILANTTEAPA
jgi:hypothetical protein